MGSLTPPNMARLCDLDNRLMPYVLSAELDKRNGSIADNRRDQPPPLLPHHGCALHLIGSYTLTNPPSDAELSFAVRVGLLLNALVGAVSLVAVLIWLLRYSVRLRCAS
jgi:hypothetical protein